MGWSLTKFLKGSSHKGRYDGKYEHDRTWDEPRNSVEEDIDFAIAMSLSELDEKGKSVIEDDSQSEDEEQSSKVFFVINLSAPLVSNKGGEENP